MKVLFLDQFSEFGGAQRCLIDLMPPLLKAGWDVRALLPGEGPLAGALRRLKVPVSLVRCGPYTLGRKTFRDVLRFAGDYRALSSNIAAAIDGHAPDLIYVNGPRLVPAAARASRSVPVLFHSHSYLSQRYVVSLIGHALRNSGASVIASSRFVASPWLQYSDVSVIYNGIREIPFVPKLAPANRPWRIGIIGRIAAEKGQLEFARAARELVDRGLQAEFHVCGAPLWSSDEYFAAVRSAAEGLDVRFSGWCDTIDTFLHALDLLVVPSPSHESTTRVVLEAFSAGTPVVAFPSGGITEVIEHRKTGFLTRSVTVRALTEGILSAIEQPQALAEIAATAREEWHHRFNLSRYCEDVIEAMELAARRNKTGNNKAATVITAAAVPNTGA